MKTVPLHGKNARGRVALVDDGDYELVMRHRWYVYEVEPEPGKNRGCGPYAFTMVGSKRDGARTSIRMHILIMGAKGIDHRDHDGLNNQRYNLRAATERQNNRNQRSRFGFTSQHKGVYWSRQKRRWHAMITVDGNARHLGFYVSEVEAALAYDDAALRWFGEFACPNFPDGVAQATRDRLRAEREAANADRNAEAGRVRGAQVADWWERREPETRVCTICGGEYLARSLKKTLYCGGACSARAKRQRDIEKLSQDEPAPGTPGTRACEICGRTYRPMGKTSIYCSSPCNKEAWRRRHRQRQPEGSLS